MKTTESEDDTNLGLRGSLEKPTATEGQSSAVWWIESLAWNYFCVGWVSQRNCRIWISWYLTTNYIRYYFVSHWQDFNKWIMIGKLWTRVSISVQYTSYVVGHPPRCCFGLSGYRYVLPKGVQGSRNQVVHPLHPKCSKQICSRSQFDNFKKYWKYIIFSTSSHGSF